MTPRHVVSILRALGDTAYCNCASQLAIARFNSNVVALVVDYNVHMCTTTPKVSICGSDFGCADVHDTDVHGHLSVSRVSDAQYLSDSVRLCCLGADERSDNDHPGRQRRYHRTWPTEEVYLTRLYDHSFHLVSDQEPLIFIIIT